MLLWSLRLDRELLLSVPDISLFERLRLVICKYLFFVRDRVMSAHGCRQSTVFGLSYRYNDRFGLGSIQRVYCSSWKLKELVPDRPTVVDVGANLGQFNLFCRQYLGAERVISIEPLPSCYQVLVENSGTPSDCINMLVSEREGATAFYVAKDSQLSSSICDRRGDYDEQIMVPGKPLERMLESAGIDRIDLLKIDTEGSEMEVLRSAGAFLDRTDVVLVEMSIFRENKGNLFEIGGFLESRGFRLHDLVFAESPHPADADGIFVRA
jgi:FkbM family methyltransferase